jgi:hypothetical protein
MYISGAGCPLAVSERTVVVNYLKGMFEDLDEELAAIRSSAEWRLASL